METLKFPLFIDLTGKKVLIVGGGKVAARRAKTLCTYGADVTIISPEIVEEICQLPVAIHKKEYFFEDLVGSFLVLAATNNSELNCQIAAEARALGIPANNASDQTDCDFFFPAVILTQEYSIGISGTGKDHHAVARTAAAIRSLMEEHT